MHYVLVISSLTAGGAERVLSGLANRWANQDHQVSIISFKNSPAFYPLDKRVQCVWLPEAPQPYLRFVFFLLKAFMFRYHIWRLKPDKILSFLDKTNLLTLFMLWGQGYLITVSERINPWQYYIHPIWRWIRKKLYPTAHHVVVQTPEIGQYFSHPTVVIPNPVPQALKHTTIRPRATKWISIGRLDPQKDHTTLIKAVHALIPQYPNIRLTIYGEGPLRPQLEQMIKDLKLTEHVSLPGLTNNIPAALLRSDLFIFPSLFEGFPNALCEAMTHGLPVIASHIPGNTDVVQNNQNGRLFPVGDANALAQACEEIIDNQELRTRWGKEAVITMQAFHPDIIGQKWDAIMK